ncbi:MAG: carboxypeptidase-like regulatory domain-containing protein [Terracidiphilus sp.]
MKAFGIWVAGIIAVVLGGWGTWYLTRPPAVTTVEGMVYSGNAAVPNAMVEIDLTGDTSNTGAVHDLTDQNGAYKIEFTGLPSGSGATLRASASGFKAAKAQTLKSPLEPDTHLDFALVSVILSEAPAAVAGARPTPHLPVAAHVPIYIPKEASRATMIKIR